MVINKSRGLASLVTILALLGGAALLPGTSLAAGPEFSVYASTPDSAQPGESFNITIAVENTGTERSRAPLTIADTAGPGLAVPVSNESFTLAATSVTFPETSEEGRHPTSCETSGSTYTCTTAEALPPGGQFTLRLESTVAGGASGTLVNHVSVTGGGVGTSSSQQEIAVGPPGPFAIKQAGATLLDNAENPAQQAAAVPADFTTTLHFRTATGGYLGGLIPITASTEHFKNVTVHLPVGLVGNPTAAPKCTAGELTTSRSIEDPVEEGVFYGTPSCPEASQVGIVHLEISGTEDGVAGLYNMVPPPGAATELGFEYGGTVITLDAYVRPGDHGIDIVSRNTSTTLPVTDIEVTAWGDPASHSHDRVRGRCLGSLSFFEEGANGQVCPSNAPEKAFLRLPTSCSGEGLAFGAESNSYENLATTASASFMAPALTGCERVPFSPTIFVQPTTTAANSPTGLAVQLSNPQNSNPEGLAEADLKKAVVTLPEGMALNPSSADGLTACSDAQFGAASAAVAECPEASKVGTVVLHTPLLENPIEGGVYVLTQQSSDPESGQMFRIGMELRDDQHGIDIKVTGALHVNKTTGRITTTFDNNPQLPFSDITLHFKAGARAPLVTPPACSAQTTEADLYPWSAPESPVHRDMTFNLTSGPNGSPCMNPWPFNPGFNAGVTSVQAGGFTPLLTTFTRTDVDQSLQGVSVKLPPGLSGSLAGLPLCPETQANAGTCSQASEIGTVTAGAGAGPTPFYVTGGHVYMTGAYKGAPFGLSVVVPAKAGPYDLGTVVVRAKVDVDPHTAQLTVTTDPLPQIVAGVPVNLRLVNVTINRPGFTFNPTNCNPVAISGSVTGGQGAVAAVSNHFQVTNCGALAFKPKFAASTSGKTSKANGASLSVKLTYPNTPQGTEANIAKVKVDLPKQLPSRLTTLQKACLAATFEANPASCPAASVVGHAKAITPILPVPLEGPAYFVSHGGEAFPSLIVVLQGYGVTVDLVGTTFISKAGITSSTFKAVPDVPVGSFELTLPQGKYSALAANGNLCTSKLAMPTAFVGQNGTEIHESTPIAVTGCAKAKPPTRAQKLAKALNACKNKPKTKRAACQQQAHKQYGPTQKKKAKQR
jgi:hypothetical protein